MLYDALNAAPNKNLQEIRNLPILNMIIHEAMRMCPLIPIFARFAEQDLTLDKSLILPKGTQCMVSVYHIHRDKQEWGPNADEFHPEHFLPENIARRNPDVYLPFSSGLRTCLGSNYGLNATKIILANAILRYEFKTTTKLNENTIARGLKNLKFGVFERKAKIF